MAETDARFGRAGVLVNAAGPTGRGNLLNTSPDPFDRTFAAGPVEPPRQ